MRTPIPLLALALLSLCACGGDAPGGAADMSVNPATPYLLAGLRSGACILEYNTALVAPNADPCCYAVGRPNTCDTSIMCSVAAGGGCCKVYSTPNTTIGNDCCYYNPNKPISAAVKDACAALLAGR